MLAYSGGLDTSIAVRWMRENWDVEVIACAVDVGQLKPGETELIHERARAAGAVEVEVIDARARVRRALHRSRAARQRAVRGQVSAGVRPVTSGDRRAPRRIGAPAPRHRGRPRLHGQGQRSGPVRGVVADPGTRSRRARARPRLGAHPRRLHRARGQVGDPDRGDRREALLDRREHVGPRHRVRRAREPLDLAAGGAVHVDAQRQGRARGAARHRRRVRARAFR